MEIKTAVFDLDGTLLDSMPMWLTCGERYISSLGMVAEPGLGEKLLSMNMKEGADFLRERYALKLTDEEIFKGIDGVLEKTYGEEILFKEGAGEFLQKLKAGGTRIALCTNTDRCLFMPAFKRLDAEKYFDFIFTAGELGMSKAQPGIFYKVCETMGTKPEETWMFEDALYSIRTAFRAGLKTCGIWDASAVADEAEIRKHSTVYCRTYAEAERTFF